MQVSYSFIKDATLDYRKIYAKEMKFYVQLQRFSWNLCGP